MNKMDDIMNSDISICKFHSLMQIPSCHRSSKQAHWLPTTQDDTPSHGLPQLHSRDDATTRDEAAGLDILTKIEHLAGVARKKSVPVLHCLIGGTQDPASTSKMADRWGSALMPASTSQPRLLAELSELLEEGDLTLNRRVGTVSAMKSGGMLDFLEDKGTESLLLCGVSTSGVVTSTARDATDLGFVVTVVRDGCWDPVDAAHRAIMDHVLPMTAWVVDDETAA
jgi:nicotinamidase-related amidase